MFQPIRTYKLSPFSELRLVTETSFSPVSIPPSVLLLNTPFNDPSVPCERGSAEIFGRELIPDMEISIGEGEKLAIFTWVGCTLQVKGHVQQEYEAYDNAMREYLNLVNALDAERESAAIKNTHGPRILVTGSPSSGKSSICMMLCNYALRNGWTPVFVEADPRASTDKKPLNFYPGTIGATVVTSIEDSLPRNPLIHFYGYSYIQDNEWLYLHVRSTTQKITFLLQTCKTMSVNIELMMEQNLKLQPHSRRTDEVKDMEKYIASSGLIINAPYQASKDTIVRLAEIFKVTMIVVIDSPSIHQDLVKAFTVQKNTIPTKPAFDGSGVDFVSPNLLGNLAFAQPNEPASVATEIDNPKIPKEKRQVLVLGASKLEGVVPVDNDRLKYLNFMCWKRYFEIGSSGKFHVVRFKMLDTNFVFIDTIEALSKDAFPTDEQYSMKSKELYASPWSGDPFVLTNSIVAVPATEDMDLIPYSNIIAFFHIRSVELNEDTTQNFDGDMVEDSESVKTYILEATCHSFYSPTSLPKFLIVPGNLKTMKWIPN
ncbi:conserved hypothetical protein [Theileria equi strain WA]|uniref:Uncharacterized protein n=1 Tax=Theileria equi strain WA TaxID=1537102 RepID=L1LFU5_THEEQ|nr:conserved hypothetical protein [Theileria equi strain WA]EKX74033.1 conserved hypothetical protein [Theileria equi strain WA]|eukprot:XP_004833485.1 conserved hypothetical protein [Theileria equi strain WA]